MNIKDIAAVAPQKRAPDGKAYCSLSLNAAVALARREDLTLRDVEAYALEGGIIPERYQRNIGTIGVEGQIKLIQSHVGVAGAGGLGGVVIEMLARMGVGHITVVDFDTFEESNLNRQMLSRLECLGKAKVDEAARRIKEINPATEINAVAQRITAKNCSECFLGIKLLVDALGNIADRFALQRTASSLGVPLVHAAVAGTMGQLCTVCPGDVGLQAIYGPEASAPHSGEEASKGTPMTTVCMIASLQASEVITILMGKDPVHRHFLTVIDVDDFSMKRLSLLCPSP